MDGGVPRPIKRGTTRRPTVEELKWMGELGVAKQEAFMMVVPPEIEMVNHITNFKAALNGALDAMERHPQVFPSTLQGTGHITSLDAEAPAAEKPAASGTAVLATMDRERLCNDLVNTGVAAALVGGFALSNVQHNHFEREIDAEPENLPNLLLIIYVLSNFSVHACTCGALTSAIAYKRVNELDDACVVEWAARHKIWLAMPMMKFAMGVLAYMTAVLLLAYFDLAGQYPISQGITMAVGVMSMASVFMMYGALMR